MKKIIAALSMVMLTISATSMAQPKTVTLKFIETSDVHGCFFPYDFTTGKEIRGSLARVSTYVKEQRKEYGDNLILLDNGDILQGQPISYFYNYVNTDEENIAASVINYMEYDAVTIGNHDIETGHSVYDKWIKEVKCPVIAANIVCFDTLKQQAIPYTSSESNNTRRYYTQPYTILEREGIRIAIVGMLTPAIPSWLKEELWQGLRFEEIAKSAKQAANYLKDKEKADIIIGLFHSGWDGGIKTEEYTEDATKQVATELSGFDIIFFGHDHKEHNSIETNAKGGRVVCLNPANNAMNVAEATITITKNKNHISSKAIKSSITDVSKMAVDSIMTTFFKPQTDAVKAFTSKKIGSLSNTIRTRDAFFGSSAFCDFIQNMQLSITGADISLNAPLALDDSIAAGDVTVGDMFNLYKYENQLYVMLLTGKEIRNHLEMSYDLWTNMMVSADDHLLLLNEETQDEHERARFKNFLFNFDSATGIDYEVDVTQPFGKKVRILRMSDGTPFDENKQYKVAVNSYRGNGGGELLTKGAGIPRDSLAKRIIWKSNRDQRYYLMKEIERLGTIAPKANNNWRFVPEKWTIPAAERDRKLLFD